MITDAPAASTPAIDRAALLAHVGGSTALADEIAALFVTRHRYLAAPLRAALTATDRVALAIAAHGVRCAASIVGATRAVAVCIALEAVTDLTACAALVTLLERELERAAAELAP